MSSASFNLYYYHVNSQISCFMCILMGNVIESIFCVLKPAQCEAGEDQHLLTKQQENSFIGCTNLV